MPFTVRWYIKNCFLYWKNRKEPLVSPEFVVGCLDNTKWNLCLYKNEFWNVNYIGFFLQPSDAFPKSFEVDFQLSILASDGTSLKSYEVTRKSVLSGVGIENSQFMEQNEVLKKRAEFLPEGILTIECQLWNHDVQQSYSESCFIRTHIEVDHRTFIGDVERFSFLQPNQKIPIVLRPNTDNKPSISMNITISDTHGDGHIIIGITGNFELKLKISAYKLYILDAAGKKVECGQDEEPFGVSSKFILFFSKSQLVDRNLQYLPNDVLTLGCECIFLTGGISHKFEENNSEFNFSANTEEHLCSTNDLKNDLLGLYNDGSFSDVKLRVDTETFTAHRLILSARSPVFNAMFSNDMKEKTNKCVDIADVDSATVRRLLLYLYTDTLENLQWQPASQLYVAADKYAVLSLRNKCSSILKINLRPSNACEVLVLADMHNDTDLKLHVQNFILDHDKALILSDEWKDFMKNYLRLASEIMYMDLERKMGHQKI